MHSSWVHDEPSHWLHEISVSKTVHHHFSPGLTPFQELGYLIGDPVNMRHSHTIHWKPVRTRLLVREAVVLLGITDCCGNWDNCHIKSIVQPDGQFLGETVNTPPIELCPAPSLGLTVQPCGEPCGFDFLTLEVIWIQKKLHYFQPLDLFLRIVQCSVLGGFGFRICWAPARKLNFSREKEDCHVKAFCSFAEQKYM
jgi:hypothetical protein